MNIGEIEAHAVKFGWNSKGNAEIVVPSKNLEFFKFREEFGSDVKQCEGLEFDGSGKMWFAVYVEDCFDPPICIVRADNASEAEEIFVNTKNWADVSEPDLKDYSEDQLNATERGTMYDPESVSVREVFLSSIVF